MASRSNLLGSALLVLTLACTQPGTAPEPTDRDVFASTPTIGAGTSTTTTTVRRTTTTRPDVERSSMYRVGPLLDLIEGFDPIPMGDWWRGVASPDGSWLLTQVESETGRSEVRLVDLRQWRVVRAWDSTWHSGMTVTDDGIVYLIQGAERISNLTRLGVSDEAPTKVADLVPDFVSFGDLHILGKDAIGVFGVVGMTGNGAGGVATVLTVDTAVGRVTEISLPDVTIGVVEEIDLGEDWPGLVDVYPGQVWDEAGGRALVVNGDRPVVTEVDLAGGSVTEHAYSVEPPLAPLVGSQVTAVFDAMEGRLYRSSTRSRLEIDGDWWARFYEPTGITVIDTDTWEVVGHLDEPISTIALSPDGRRLVGSGFTAREGSDDVYESATSGTYLIDAVALEVIAHLEPPRPDSWPGLFEFDPRSTVAYVTRWDVDSYLDVIDLDTGEVLATRQGDQLQVLGQIGVMSDWTGEG